MRALFLLAMSSLCGFGQGYVRPWVMAPPVKKAAGALHSVMLDAAPPEALRSPKRRVTLELPAAGFPFPLLLTPCTSFPGNPVFVIEVDKITMRKLDR
ncbi:MAG: hypothetical protein ABI806_01910 [Candidatus Solibacter sp.]